MKEFETIYVCMYEILLENNKYLKAFSLCLFPGKLLPRIYHESRFHRHLQNTEDFVDVVEHF